MNLSSMHIYHSSKRDNLYLRPVLFNPFKCVVQIGRMQERDEGVSFCHHSNFNQIHMSKHATGINFVYSTRMNAIQGFWGIVLCSSFQSHLVSYREWLYKFCAKLRLEIFAEAGILGL